MKKQKRTRTTRAPRVAAALPVELDRARGVMRDVSATGIFFETDARYSVGSPIRVALNLAMPWGKVMFRCDGRIVRVEPHDGRVGVAVQFTDSSADAEPATRKVVPRKRKRSRLP